MSMKTYSELEGIERFVDRYRYLRLCDHAVGDATFGSQRFLNQKFYHWPEWQKVRNDVIVRDDGNDLGDPLRPIKGLVVVHHIEPISVADILERTDKLLSPDNLICCSTETHRAIHYGSEDSIFLGQPIERRPNDTCPWRK